MAEPMKPGQKYYVLYQIEGVHRIPRTMVATFLGDVGNGGMSFSGRPHFGTTELKESWIKEAVSVDSSVICYIDRKWR